MYEHAKTGCKHIPPSEQPLQFQSEYYFNKPRVIYIFQFLCLTPGHSIFTQASKWVSLFIFQVQKGSEKRKVWETLL